MGENGEGEGGGEGIKLIGMVLKMMRILHSLIMILLSYVPILSCKAISRRKM